MKSAAVIINPATLDQRASLFLEDQDHFLHPSDFLPNSIRSVSTVERPVFQQTLEQSKGKCFLHDERLFLFILELQERATSSHTYCKYRALYVAASFFFFFFSKAIDADSALSSQQEVLAIQLHSRVMSQRNSNPASCF